MTPVRLTMDGSSAASSARNVTTTQIAPRAVISSINARSSARASSAVVEAKLSFMITTLARPQRRRGSSGPAVSSASSRPVRSAGSSARANSVWTASPRPSARPRARDRDADRRQVVELPDRPGEGGLAALVRTGDDDEPLGVGEVEVVRHDAVARRVAPQRQRQVEQAVGRRARRAGRRDTSGKQNGNPASRSGPMRSSQAR